MNLIEAIKQDNINVIINMLSRKVDINYHDRYNDTALTWACYLKKYEYVKLLLNNGANPNIHGYKRMTPLHQLYLNHDYEYNYDKSPKIVDFVQQLIDFKADVNLKEDTHTTVVMMACKFNDQQSLNLLLDMKADPNIKNIGNTTSLLISCFHGYNNQIRLLLEYGANFDDLHVANKLNNDNNKLQIIKYYIDDHHKKIFNIVNQITVHNITEKGIIHIITNYI